MRLGVFGGTFDPPHLGHLVVAEGAREQLGLERVLFIPAGQPWMKAGQAVSPAFHRLEMTRLAIQGHPAFQLVDWEVAREGPSYTVETLEQLHRQEPSAELFCILGEDSLRELPRWRDPQRLIELCVLATYRRPGSEGLQLAELEDQVPGVSHRVLFLEGPLIGISATDLRHRAAQGRSLRYLVPSQVEAYIRQHRLYQNAEGG